MKIKAVSLWQPWASMVPPPGPKSLETRGWDTSYRGPLLICASKKVMSWTLLFELGKQEEWLKALRAVLGYDYIPSGCMAEEKPLYFAKHVRQKLPYGVAVATCNLVGTYRTETLKAGTMLTNNLPFGDFSAGRYAWNLRDRKAIKPFPVWGRQGLFEVEIPEGLV
jgi:hypothetical protein